MPEATFSDLVRLFASSLIEKRRWSPALTEALAERLLVEAEHRQASHLIAESDPARVGYLKSVVAGRNLFVPFTLVEGIPSAALLATLVATTDEMKFSADSTLCLSGSTTFLGALTSVADLDVAEYSFEAPAIWPQRLEELARRAASQAVLVRAFAGGVPSDAPFTRAIEALRKRGGKRKVPNDQDTVFLEFVTIGAQQSPLAGSNKVLGVVRGRAHKEAGRLSHVFQEIVISQGDPPPRTLVAPAELGNYLNFLRVEAEEALRRDRPLKAAKRLLAIARLIGAKPIGDVLVEILNGYAAVTQAVARRKAAGLIAVLPETKRRALGLDPAKASPEPIPRLPAWVYDTVFEIKNRLSEGFAPLPAAGRRR